MDAAGGVTDEANVLAVLYEQHGESFLLAGRADRLGRDAYLLPSPRRP
nr:hypothetical protein [Streptomyces cacaoi]